MGIRLARAYVPGRGNGDKISLCYPRVPMSLECLFRDSLVLQLPKCPFINNFGVVRVVEQAGGNPGLADSTKVQRRVKTPHMRAKRACTRTSITSHPPRLTPRTFCDPYWKLGLNARTAGRQAENRAEARASFIIARDANDSERPHTQA